MNNPYFQNELCTLYFDDCLNVLKRLESNSIDLIFADPPYFLSNNGISCHSGRQVSVNKALWDKSLTIEDKLSFNKKWLTECRRVLKDDGTIWVSGTLHNIYSVGVSLEETGYSIINNITWQKPNPTPNLSCRCFTNSTETILWARKQLTASKKGKHFFNYHLMKKMNVNKIKIELNILNSLVGSKNIEKEFVYIVKQYPNVLSVIPVLLAKREKEIKVNDAYNNYIFSFIKMNYTIEQYVLFMKNSGLFDLLQNRIINNLIDYVLGVEVGMDTNGRKNRTGDVMEDIIESYLIKSGLIKGKSYFKEMKKSEVERKFGLDLSLISNNGKTEKRFDFVFIGALGTIFACECNFFSSGGSKLNETARSYKNLAIESSNIKGFEFVWFTDGIGWKTARHNLEETYDILENIYNLNDLENGCLDYLINNELFISRKLKK